ncbi:MAG: hypothetical protein ACE5LX_10210, partial [Nitrospinota bacterium]
IEVYHPSHSLALSRYYLRLARRKGFLVVGGSDCHGPDLEEELIGKVKLPMAYVEALKGALSRRANWE